MGAIRTLVNELRRRGVTVHEWSGWDGRGNEGVAQIDPKGAIIHHTATNYGAAFADLVSSTQPWARGNALCNFSGNADGSFTVLASGIGWHAGQGAGPSLGKLAPWRNRLNYYSVGLEIVYPGDKPMTGAQYRSALLFAKTVADLFGGGDIECVRAHAETNGRGGDGKWDPGYAPGKTIDMTTFRREAANPQEDDMANVSAEQLATLLDAASAVLGGKGGVRSAGEHYLMNLNTHRAVQALAVKLDALAGQLSDDEANILAAVRAQPTGGQVTVDVDVDQLAAKLREGLGDALADELAARLARA